MQNEELKGRPGDRMIGGVIPSVLDSVLHAVIDSGLHSGEVLCRDAVPTLPKAAELKGCSRGGTGDERGKSI